jgi:hypothetical protein
MKLGSIIDPSKQWDVFISHASENKESFVRPLAKALVQLGVSVWYDEFSLRIGDSLSQSIDKGIAGSRCGLVVLSRDFIAKPWPMRELGGLVAREISEDRVILPVWHGVTRDDVLHFSPTLADKWALDTTKLSAKDVAISVLREVRQDIYLRLPRKELERIADGVALRDLQLALEAAREELTEYRCPYCGSPVAVRIDAPVDREEQDWEMRESFECGYQRFGGYMEQPCPRDPRFPKFE